MKLQDKLTEILGIEGFRVGDVVENLDSNLLVLYNLANQTMFCMADIDDNYLESAWYKKDDLKLISRDFTLSEVLMAFQIVRKFHTTLQITNKGYLEYWGMDDIIWQKDWDLTKTLFQQSKETITAIEKIMGG